MTLSTTRPAHRKKTIPPGVQTCTGATDSKTSATHKNSLDCAHIRKLIPLHVSLLATPLQSDLVESHVKACVACARHMNQLRQNYETLCQTPTPQSALDTWAQWMSSTREYLQWSDRFPSIHRRFHCFPWLALTIGLLAGLLAWGATNVARHYAPRYSDLLTPWLFSPSPQPATTPISATDTPNTSANTAAPDTAFAATMGAPRPSAMVIDTLLPRMQSYEWMMWNALKSGNVRSRNSAITYVSVTPKDGYGRPVDVFNYLKSLISQYDIQLVAPPRQLNLDSFLPHTLMLTGHNRNINIAISALQRRGVIQMKNAVTPWKRLPVGHERALVHFVP